MSVAIETWLRLRTSLLVPMQLLQPLESGVLALVSCCDKKQVPSNHLFFLPSARAHTHPHRHSTLKVKFLTSLQIQQIHSCSSAAVRSLLRELVQLHDTSYKYTGIA